MKKIDKLMESIYYESIALKKIKDILRESGNDNLYSRCEQIGCIAFNEEIQHSNLKETIKDSIKKVALSLAAVGIISVGTATWKMNNDIEKFALDSENPYEMELDNLGISPLGSNIDSQGSPSIKVSPKYNAFKTTVINFLNTNRVDTLKSVLDSYLGEDNISDSQLAKFLLSHSGKYTIEETDFSSIKSLIKYEKYYRCFKVTAKNGDYMLILVNKFGSGENIIDSDSLPNIVPTNVEKKLFRRRDEDADTDTSIYCEYNSTLGRQEKEVSDDIEDYFELDFDIDTTYEKLGVLTAIPLD